MPVVVDSSAAAQNVQNALSEADFEDLLRQYYGRLFPYKKYYRWLSYGMVNKNTFANREFSFTLKDDVYLRFKSFTTKKELKTEILKLNPYKIDIGAVYRHKPREHKTIKASEFVPEEKELVFDIDMTDYDDIRTCCSDANICNKCWPFMSVAIKIIDRALEEDFGFKHRLWIYSGRRGVHCWVCDKRARSLTIDGRTAIVEYLSVVKGGDHTARKVEFNSPQMHPALSRALQIIDDDFAKITLRNQDILNSPTHAEKILSLVPDKEQQALLKEAWEDSSLSSIDKWGYLKGAEAKNKGRRFHWVEEIMFQYTYPRLDVNVSKGINHLLKSPFCVHPKTGRVCVPIDVTQVESFNPFQVPTIAQLLAEIDVYDRTHTSESSPTKDLSKTTLSRYMLTFERFLSGLEEDLREERRMAMDTEDSKLQF
eukprot:Colp12_sorted_trinity150504_noHs@10760